MITTLAGLRRYGAEHPRVVDAALIVLLCMASGPATLYSSLPYGVDRLDWWPGVPLAAIGSLALFWRRTHPRTVVVFTAVCASAAGGIGYLITPLLLAPVMAALYELAVRVSRKTSYLYCLGVITLIVLTAVLAEGHASYPWPLTTINPTFCLMLPVALGSAARLRYAYLEAVQARAEFAERTREEEARNRVAEERVRIARELHDVVAHHLALANAQAGTAAYLARDNSEVRPILDELAGTTSSALREMKATVGLLRRPGEEGSPLEPAPGLHQLPDLIAAFDSGGLDVTFTVEGERRPLSPGVDLTAYRIVQESLTNVAKHAATRAAHVHLAYGGDRLTLTVSDDGSPGAPVAADPGTGFGLIGMRERAESAGGHLEAGRRPGGGFTVTTELPLLP